MAIELKLSGANDLCLREGGDRRRSDRRAHPREGGQDRRQGDRRRAGVRSVLLTAITMGLPHQLSPAVPVIPEAPKATVTVTINSAVGVPASRAYDPLIREAATKFRVDAVLIRSVMQTESAFDALAVSRAGAQGLMQLMPALAKQFGVEDPFDPRQNIMAGTAYLKQLLRHHRGDVRLALASYNAGMGVVAEYGGVPPFPETQHYIARVTALLK